MKQADNNLRLLVGMPEKSARGGINACEPPFLSELRRMGVEVREEIYSFGNDERTGLLRRIRQVAGTARKFSRILGDEDFDLLHVNTAFDLKALLRDAYTLFWLKKRKTRIFLKFHGSDAQLLDGRNFFIRRLVRYLVENSDGIGVLSAEEKQNFVRSGLPEKKFFVVKNAITIGPEESFPPVENFSGGPFRLLFAARLIPTKGLMETVEAAAILHEQGLDVTLDVLGDGEARPAAEKLAGELKSREIVRFHGHLPETRVQEFYRTGDLLVFPTFHQEGFPMVIFNALPFGLPIVTTKIRAAADYLREGENCLFCEARNARSVAAKITELMENDSLRQKISENNRRLAKEFLPGQVAPEYLEIYKKIVAGR